MRFYLSNIRPAWSFERQEAVIAAAFPGWRRGVSYRDDLPPRKRKQHGPEDLAERATMLRPSSRRYGTALHVASLAVLAWTPADLADVLACLRARGERLTSLEDGTMVPEDPDNDQITGAVEAFKRAARRTGEYGKPGGVVSGERRSAAARAACERVRERWGMSSGLWTIDALAAEVGVSRPTLFRYLGKREDAQRAYDRALALAERNRIRRKR